MNTGLYHLVLLLSAPVETRVGALGTVSLPAGWYVYTGSGGVNLERRVERHFRRSKPLRWHIDYLTTHPDVTVVCAVQVKRKKEKGKSIVDGSGGSSGCEEFLGQVKSKKEKLKSSVDGSGGSNGCEESLGQVKSKREKVKSSVSGSGGSSGCEESLGQVKSKKENGKSGGSETGGLSECEAHRRVGRLLDGLSVVPRFGSGDCRSGCSSHLWRAGRDDVAALLARLPGAEIVTPPGRSNAEGEGDA